MIISQYYHFFRSRRSSKVSPKGQTEYFHLILRSDSLKVTDEVDKYKKILTIWYDKMTYLNDQSVLLIFVLFFHTVSRLCYLSNGQTHRDVSLWIVPWPCFLKHSHFLLSKCSAITLKTLKFKYIPWLYSVTLKIRFFCAGKCEMCLEK